MATKEDILKKLDWSTEKISERIWTTSVGVLATCLTFIIESSRSDGHPFLSPYQIAGPAALALLALMFDLLQYIVAYIQILQSLRRIQKENIGYISYKVNSIKKIRHLAFYAKITASVSAVGWLTVEIISRAFVWG